MSQERSTTFTCFCYSKGLGRYEVLAENPADADRKVDGACLIIQGTAESVGAIRVKKEPGKAYEDTHAYIDWIEGRGIVCTFAVDGANPVMVIDAVFEEIEVLGLFEFLRFCKNGVKMWAYIDDLYFRKVGDWDFEHG